LHLRADNADSRLTHLGRAAGCVGDTRHHATVEAAAELDAARELLQNAVLTAAEWSKQCGAEIAQDGKRKSALEVLGFRGITQEVVARAVPEFAGVSERVARRLEVEAVYAPMMEKQQMSIDT
jgi:tRNA uridine 5-carboxymethylaminomethyl modification enzyme